MTCWKEDPAGSSSSSSVHGVSVEGMVAFVSSVTTPQHADVRQGVQVDDKSNVGHNVKQPGCTASGSAQKETMPIDDAN